MLTGPMTNRRSNAKTAYGLMSDIKTYILEEPKRVWMGDWIITDMDEIEDAFETEGPACGTVGCIAGNVRVLTGRLNDHRSTSSVAIEILSGASEREDNNLQDALYTLFHDTEVKASYGTKKYAQIVAKRIEAFQIEHESALRAVKL